MNKEKINIITLCSFGVGTSLILKINIESILNELNKNFEVSTSDILTVTSLNPDFIVTSNYLLKDMKDKVSVPIIGVENFINKKDLKNSLVTILKVLNL